MVAMLNIIRALFLILFIAAIIAAAVTSVKDVKQIREVQTLIDQKTEKLDEIRAARGKTSLESRGYSESIRTLPDSTRKAEAGRISIKQRGFVKTIRTMTRDENGMSRMLKKHEKEMAQIKTHLKLRLLKFGGSALAFLLGFIVCTRIKTRP